MSRLALFVFMAFTISLFISCTDDIESEDVIITQEDEEDEEDEEDGSTTFMFSCPQGSGPNCDFSGLYYMINNNSFPSIDHKVSIGSTTIEFNFSSTSKFNYTIGSNCSSIILRKTDTGEFIAEMEIEFDENTLKIYNDIIFPNGYCLLVERSKFEEYLEYASQNGFDCEIYSDLNTILNCNCSSNDSGYQCRSSRLVIDELNSSHLIGSLYSQKESSFYAIQENSSKCNLIKFDNQGQKEWETELTDYFDYGQDYLEYYQNQIIELDNSNILFGDLIRNGNLITLRLVTISPYGEIIEVKDTPLTAFSNSGARFAFHKFENGKIFCQFHYGGYAILNNQGALLSTFSDLPQLPILQFVENNFIIVDNEVWLFFDGGPFSSEIDVYKYDDNLNYKNKVKLNFSFGNDDAIWDKFVRYNDGVIFTTIEIEKDFSMSLAKGWCLFDKNLIKIGDGIFYNDARDADDHEPFIINNKLNVVSAIKSRFKVTEFELKSQSYPTKSYGHYEDIWNINGEYNLGVVKFHNEEFNIVAPHYDFINNLSLIKIPKNSYVKLPICN